MIEEKSRFEHISVAILDADMTPLAVSFSPEFICEVASRLAAEMHLPPAQTGRYSIERARWMVLKELAGEDPTDDPPDGAYAVWEYVVDSETTDAHLPKESTHNTKEDQSPRQ